MLRQPLWLASSPSSSRVLLTGQRYSSNSLLSRVTQPSCVNGATRSFTSVRALGTMPPVSPMVRHAVRGSNLSLRFMYSRSRIDREAKKLHQDQEAKKMEAIRVAKANEQQWSQRAAYAKYTRLTFLLIGMYGIGYQQGIIDYAREPEQSQQGLLLFALSEVGVVTSMDQVDILRVSSSQQVREEHLTHHGWLNLLSRRKTSTVVLNRTNTINSLTNKEVAMTGHRVVCVAQAFVRSELAKAQQAARQGAAQKAARQEAAQQAAGQEAAPKDAGQEAAQQQAAGQEAAQQAAGQEAVQQAAGQEAAQQAAGQEPAQQAAGQEPLQFQKKEWPLLSYSIKPEVFKHKTKEMIDANPWEDEAVEFWLQAQRRLEGGDWQYVLVDTPKPNAFVSEILPRRIFVTTGMLESLATRQQNANTADADKKEKRIANGFVANNDELALVLGHEVSHLILGHVSKQNHIQALLCTVEVLLLSFDPTDGFLSFCMLHTLAVMRLAVSAAYSRKDEREADELGMILCAMAGCDLTKACHVFYKMAQAKGPTRRLTIMSSHPPTMERYEYLMEKAKELTKIQQDQPQQQGNLRKSW